MREMRRATTVSWPGRPWEGLLGDTLGCSNIDAVSGYVTVTARSWNSLAADLAPGRCTARPSPGVPGTCQRVVPHPERPHQPLLPGKEQANAAPRKVRARVEQVIGRMKYDKALRDCGQRGEGPHLAVQAVALMHDLALAS